MDFKQKERLRDKNKRKKRKQRRMRGLMPKPENDLMRAARSIGMEDFVKEAL